jgi:uncharacterized DUF497 family protein
MSDKSDIDGRAALAARGSQGWLAGRLRDTYTIGMRWAADAEAAAWLATAPELEWDTANTAKLTKHGLTRTEVDSILGGIPYLLGRMVEPAHDEPRWVALGLTATSRYITMIFTRRGTRLRPISCRAMRRKERRLYEERRSEEPPTT